jgi:hypothetical protein
MSYGKITYDAMNRCWDVQCESSVSRRLRRLFGEACQRSVGHVVLPDTPYVARQLLDFTWRYPMTYEVADLYGRATASTEDVARAKREVSAALALGRRLLDKLPTSQPEVDQSLFGIDFATESPKKQSD